VTFSIDIDIGGTYTDAIIAQKKLSRFLKVDTTPHDLSQCVQQILERAVSILRLPNIHSFLCETDVVRLSTSLSTNLLLEGRGARCGLLLSRGWREHFLAQPLSICGPKPVVFENDVLEIGREATPPRNRCAGRLSEEEVREKARVLLERGATILVVSLVGTEVKPDPELYVKNIIQRYYPRHCIGSVPVVMGIQISNTPDYITRTNTAVLNAFCHRSIASDLFKVQEFLQGKGCRRPLLVVNASEGTTRVAKTKAIQTINSGAAAGIFGVSKLANLYQKDDVISVDVGGTSTEIGVIRNKTIAYAQPTQFAGLPVDVSFPVFSTLGIGGGSVARIDNDGTIKVGPESSGSFPGPACYNLGGSEPTLTDAYLVLGYIDEKYFLGGQKAVRRSAAQEVFTGKIAEPLGISCEEAAFKVKEKAVALIGNAMRTVVAKTGLDFSKAPVFALGGGGGCIGAHLADFVGSGEIMVFRQGSVFGSFGSSNMDVTHIYERRLSRPIFQRGVPKKESCHELNRAVVALQRVAFKDMRGEGFKDEEIRFAVEVEVRASGVKDTARITLPNPFLWIGKDWKCFLRKARDCFKSTVTSKSQLTVWVEIAILRSFGAVPHFEIGPLEKADKPESSYKTKRRLYVGGGTWREAKVYEWDLLSVPRVLVGPAILESRDTNIVIPPGKNIAIDHKLNGTITTGKI